VQPFKNCCPKERAAKQWVFSSFFCLFFSAELPARLPSAHGAPASAPVPLPTSSLPSPARAAGGMGWDAGGTGAFCRDPAKALAPRGRQPCRDVSPASRASLQRGFFSAGFLAGSPPRSSPGRSKAFLVLRPSSWRAPKKGSFHSPAFPRQKLSFFFTFFFKHSFPSLGPEPFASPRPGVRPLL